MTAALWILGGGFVVLFLLGGYFLIAGRTMRASICASYCIGFSGTFLFAFVLLLFIFAVPGTR